jgi:ISXO2-like transposase domain
MKAIDIYREPQNDRSVLFLENNKSIEYLRLTDRLADNENCSVCGYRMKLIKSQRHLSGFLYSCQNKHCRKTKTIFIGKLINTPKIDLCTYLFAIYKWIENDFEKDVLRNLNVAKTSFQKIKKHISQFNHCEYERTKNDMLGGPGIMVQVDETAICHGYLLVCPSNLDDNMPGITWLVGFIEQNSRRVKLEIVPDRKVETFKNLFERHIIPYTTIVTDGHQSYPGAVRHIGGRHIIVNHSKGFTNIDGFHTNNIENLWSLMKYEIKRRKGIRKTCISAFLEEFHLRYCYLRSKTQEEVVFMWNKIVDYLFTSKE